MRQEAQRKAALNAIPQYFLYGEQTTESDDDLPHIEPIRYRSGSHDWIIRAHSHPDHVQILFVENGGGQITIENQRIAFEAPSFIIVPAAMIHEIRFREGTDGHVITASTHYVAAAAQGDVRLIETFDEPGCFMLSMDDPNTKTLQDGLKRMADETAWAAPGRRMATRSLFQIVLVALMRYRSRRGSEAMIAADRDYRILLRYRALLEQHFRTEKRLEFYADALGITAPRLNNACKARASRTASELLHARILIEAKRRLTYLGVTVAEIAYDLGFEDPAYFSRFFSHRVGMAPGAYRQLQDAERRQQSAFPH
ncbi:helix-turn-helix domain-containing protein [Notoacmeibacter sp. MSK16QG-6]|uniref:helix-turn-helix domain-containing protein n=1 Tax=Notoacmeibacter sp. MSK16QG-6 TaxID=2957982 RepID=UPI0020A0DB8A|nr:helix-turn-helix domain-containing protein [Notoacmeibacter sp. MSK16QG-6]MCP1198338.1 helix-turn-helix domain-containing protein [Notoacmeibacter sp. MSK16QG-6]